MIRLYIIAALVLLAGSLGGALYVAHLRASNAALSRSLQAEQETSAALVRKITADAAVRAADNARADAAEASLKTFQERADVAIADASSRLCLDRDDTRRLQRILEAPVR